MSDAIKDTKKENPSAATDGLSTTRLPSSDMKDQKMSKLNQSPETPIINLHEAGSFLESLDGIDTAYCFQTIPKLFGNHFQHVSNPEHLVGRFNGNLASTLLVFADEAFWAGDKAKLGALKTLITEPRRMIEMKHKDALEVDNYARVIMASNEDWVVPAEVDERRFCAMKVNDARKGDSEYFEAIIDERDNGGVEALMYLLQNRSLEGKDLRKFPVTGALIGQKVRNLKSYEQWLYDHLHMGEIDGRCFDDSHVKSRLYNNYAEYCRRLNKRTIVDNGTFFKWLKRTISGITDSRPLMEGKAARHITFPSLDKCRNAFEQWIGGGIPWE